MATAIVIVGGEDEIGPGDPVLNAAVPRVPHLLSLDVLGRTLVDRAVDVFLQSGIHEIRVLVCDGSCSDDIVRASKSLKIAKAQLNAALSDELKDCAEDGAEAVVILQAGGYLDLDLEEFLRFHRGHGEAVSRTSDDRGFLNLWVVDPERCDEMDWSVVLEMQNAVPYFVRGYVNRLETPQDFRKLVIDSLNSTCRLQPVGVEVRPGVWISDGAEVAKRARIVAPVFIGQDVVISEQSMITRCSNVERNSHVDYGTVVEDTSVLRNTYVGIGLDLAHSIVDGDILLNLPHGVRLRISDPAVMRPNKPLDRGSASFWGRGIVPGPVESESSLLKKASVQNRASS